MAADILLVASIVAAFVGILALFASIFFAIRQIRVATTSLQVATTALSEDRKERAGQREQRRAALLASLQAGIQAIHAAADADLTDFKHQYVSHPRIAQNPSATAIEGAFRYRLSFPWTPLPDAALVEAIREAGLLGLTPPRIQKLQSLRTRILRINALAHYKANLYAALMVADTPRENPFIYGDRPWAEDKAANLNNVMEFEVHVVLVECAEVMKWWEGDASNLDGSRPGRSGGSAARTQRAGRWHIVAAARKRISSRLSRLIRRGGA